jgi:hypothetical protein
MKTFRLFRPTLGALGLLVVLCTATRASAQESMIAMGNVNPNGSLALEVNSLDAVVTSSSPGTGDYEISISRAGAFTGTTLDDFIVETTIEGTVVSDTISSALVSAVTDDVLTLRVRTMDVEESALPASATAANEDFYFAVRRLDTSATTINGDTRFLVATGNVNSNGTLNSSFGVDGVEVSSVRNGLGDYGVTLTKTGAFTDDDAQEYLIFLTQIGSGTDDQAFCGDSSDVTGNDTSVFRVRSVDVQAAVAADNGTASDDNFIFSIYRLAGAETAGNPSSQLISAMAKVAGTGTLVSGASVFGAANVASTRSGPGTYSVTITQPGAFTDSTPSRFGAIAGINNGLIDRMVVADAEVTDANTVTVNVVTHDVQNPGASQGVAEDNAFFLVLYDTTPDLGPDLSIGTKRSLTSFKGIGTLNESGAGQGIRLNLSGTTERKFFFASSNAGDSIDGLLLKSIATAGPLETSLFRVTGGKTNITAAAKTGSLVAEGVRPGETIRFEGRTAFKSETSRPTKNMKLRGSSELQSSSRDLVKAKVVGK